MVGRQVGFFRKVTQIVTCDRINDKGSIATYGYGF